MYKYHNILAALYDRGSGGSLVKAVDVVWLQFRRSREGLQSGREATPAQVRLPQTLVALTETVKLR